MMTDPPILRLYSSVLEDLWAPRSPQQCRACGVMVAWFQDAFEPECPATEDGFHNLENWAMLPIKEATDAK